MHNITDKLGDILKNARINSQFTVEELASQVGITERYMYRIENERKIPAFIVLFKLIRSLNISPDLIYYPEKSAKNSEIEELTRMLYKCDERSVAIIRATIKAALASQEE